MMIYRLIFLLFLLTAFIRTGAQVIKIDDDISLVHLHDSVFMHVTWHEDKDFGRFSSNGLILIRKGKGMMVDTPMDNQKTERLLNWLEDSQKVTISLFVAGHFHDDCIGGLAALQRLGIRSLANALTVEKCRELQLPVPAESFSGSKVFEFQGEPVECRFFGAGHSFDNITVWLPSQKILFGGCLVKSIDSKTLGNLTDAVVCDWDKTVEKISSSYSDIELVIPGHGEPGGSALLEHTISLVKNFKSK